MHTNHLISKQTRLPGCHPIPIYIISLNRTPERRLTMQRQLDSFGLPYHWIDAVDAYDFKCTDLEGVDPDDRYQPKAMACLLSHVKLYDHIIANNHPLACVLEDDAQLLPTFPDLLCHEKLPDQNWELLLLAHHSGMTRRLLNLYFRPTKHQRLDLLYYRYLLGAMVKNPCVTHLKNHYIAEPQGDSPSTMPMTTAAYLIRLPAVKKIRKIALSNQHSLYIDDITGCADSFGLTLKLITPPCVVVNPTYLRYSLIDPQRHERQYTSTTMQPLPQCELVQLYTRDKWIALAFRPMTKKIKIRLRIAFYST